MWILNSLVWLSPEKSQHKQESNPGSAALEAFALTTRPTRQFRLQSSVMTIILASSKEISFYMFEPKPTIAVIFLRIFSQNHRSGVVTIEQKLCTIQSLQFPQTNMSKNASNFVPVNRSFVRYWERFMIPQNDACDLEQRSRSFTLLWKYIL